jgi:hypothetical protein
MTIVTSGMTVTYTDPSSHLTLTNAWVQIKNINYTPNVSCQVVADVYVNQTLFQNGFSPVFYNVLPMCAYNSNDWNAFFDTSILTQAGHDIVAQAMLYLQAKLT